MTNDQLIDGVIDISDHGVHLISPENNEQYKKDKLELANAKEVAAKIVAEANEQRDKILTEAQSEKDKLLAAAKEQAIEKGAAELLLFKNKKDQQLLKHLERIEEEMKSAMKEIIQTLITESAKGEFFISQSMAIFRKHIIEPAIPSNATLKASGAMLVQLKEKLDNIAPDALQNIKFAEDGQSTDKITIELEDRVLLIDSDIFMKKLDENLLLD